MTLGSNSFCVNEDELWARCFEWCKIHFKEKHIQMHNLHVCVSVAQKRSLTNYTYRDCQLYFNKWDNCVSLLDFLLLVTHFYLKLSNLVMFWARMNYKPLSSCGSGKLLAKSEKSASKYALTWCILMVYNTDNSK